MEYFRDKRVLLTGGSSGIGLATARLLRAGRAHLVLVARDEEKLARAKEELEAIPAGQAGIRTLSLDVSDREAVSEAIRNLLAEQPVDILISNAGTVMPGSFLDLPQERFDEMMQTNFMGPVHLTRLVLPSMIERGAGHVAFISSFSGLIGIFGYTAYSASKFAICGFAECLRCEMRPRGVRVTVCYPPDTDTPQLAFEDQHKPVETRAIAGNVKPLKAATVATKLLRGMSAGRFHIVPGGMTRLAEISYRLFPGMVRSMFDKNVRKARKGKAGEEA